MSSGRGGQALYNSPSGRTNSAGKKESAPALTNTLARVKKGKYIHDDFPESMHGLVDDCKNANKTSFKVK